TVSGLLPPERRKHRHHELASWPQAQADALGHARQAWAVVPEPEFGRTIDAPLVRRRQSDANVTPLLSSLLLHAPQGGVVGHRQCLVEHCWIVATVVDVAARGFVRKLVRLDEVSSPNLDGVDAQLLRGGIDEAFEIEIAAI